MELALKTEAIDCLTPVYAQTLRKEETQDAVIPDTLPDIGTVLGASGTVLIRSKDVGEGRVRVEANVPARVLYTPEDGGRVCCVEVNVPVYLSAEHEDIPEGALCVTGLNLCALEARELNPRKVGVRAEVEFCLRCYSPGQRAFHAAPEEAVEGVNLRESAAAVTPVRSVTEKTFVLSDEFTVPPNQPAAESLLSQSVQLCLEDVKSNGSKLIVKGSARSTLLYCSAEGTAEGVEFTTAFSQIMETDAPLEDPAAALELLLSGAYYELNPDGRGGTMELHLVAQATVWNGAEVRLITDAYSNRYALDTARQTETLDSALRTLTLRETLRGTLPTEKPPADVLAGWYRLGTVQTGESGPVLPVTVTAAFRGADGALGLAVKTLTVSFTAPAEPGTRLEVLSAAGQELYLAPAAGGVEVRLPLELTARLWASETVEAVTGLSYDEAGAPDLSGLPSLVLLRAGSGDDLWTLAKENASTLRAITEANDLDALTAPWETLLLIPKAL